MSGGRQGVENVELVFTDYSLPQSLEPRTPKQVAVLSLDLAMEMGGPYLGYIRDVIRTGTFAWHIISSRWDLDPMRLAAFRAEATYLRGLGEPTVWMIKGPASPELQRILKEWGPQVIITENEAKLSRRTVADWIHEIFPETVARWGELKLFSHLREYEKRLPEVHELPWEGLRFFTGFVRKRGDLILAQDLALEWARIQALYSPQQESAEQASLASGELMLNPTLHLIRCEAKASDRQLVAIIRRGSSLVERSLSWQEAAVLDELSENSRMLRGHLLKEVEHHRASAERLGLTTDEAFAVVVERLVAEQFILVGG